MYYEDKTKSYKRFGITLFVISLVLAIIMIGKGVLGWYEYNKTYKSYWNLAVKASTIPQKTIYVDKFVIALENSGMNGEYDAVFLETPDNSFDKNLEALKTLQTRLQEIQLMDPKSFEYNTAISQITAQEQGESNSMLTVFSGIWWKTNHFMLWDWVCAINVCIVITMFVLGIRYWNYGNW
jgi:hypothetical protein